MSSSSYAPYNTLLTYYFGNSFKFLIDPQSSLSEFVARDSVHFTFLVVFDIQRRPLLIAEIQDDAYATKPDLQFKADDQIRQRYSVLNGCPLPHLWGLSLPGTFLRVYCGYVATGAVAPEFEGHPDAGRILPRSFLEGLVISTFFLRKSSIR